MAAEYYDYDHEYNFRDRDALLAGAVVSMRASFERFWDNELSVPAEELFSGVRLEDAHVRARLRGAARVRPAAGELRARGERGDRRLPAAFPQLAREVTWGRVDFISDAPGKNESRGLSRWRAHRGRARRAVDGAKRARRHPVALPGALGPALALFRASLRAACGCASAPIRSPRPTTSRPSAATATSARAARDGHRHLRVPARPAGAARADARSTPRGSRRSSRCTRRPWWWTARPSTSAPTISTRARRTSIPKSGW